MSKAIWLIDQGHLTKTSSKRFRIDYQSTIQVLNEWCGRVDGYLFNGFDPRIGVPDNQKCFYQRLHLMGIESRLHPMEIDIDGGVRQRRVDVDIASVLIKHATMPEVETIILSSGDQDLIPAVRMARDEFNKYVILFSHKVAISRDLIDSVDCFSDMQQFEARISFSSN
ncbi:NYN domain-containing protein [Candidatus Zixiibacteriota bacterium]